MRVPRSLWPCTHNPRQLYWQTSNPHPPSQLPNLFLIQEKSYPLVGAFREMAGEKEGEELWSVPVAPWQAGPGARPGWSPWLWVRGALPAGGGTCRDRLRAGLWRGDILQPEMSPWAGQGVLRAL